MARQQFKKKSRRKVVQTQQPMLFDATNYKLMAMGAGLILLGFLIMYLESEVRGFWSLYVSPIVVLAGFGSVAYSIMRKRTDLIEDAESSGAAIASQAPDTVSALPGPGVTSTSTTTSSNPGKPLKAGDTASKGRPGNPGTTSARH